MRERTVTYSREGGPHSHKTPIATRTYLSILTDELYRRTHISRDKKVAPSLVKIQYFGRETGEIVRYPD